MAVMSLRPARAMKTRMGLGRAAGVVDSMPTSSLFGISAVFHYLGPCFAVLLFTHVAVFGVAWMRIAAAAAFFAAWRRPWRVFVTAEHSQRRMLVSLGVVLAVMNSLFYLAVDRLPLSTVGAIEFLGVVVLAAASARIRRNVLALALAIGGVSMLAEVRLANQPAGFAFAGANCVCFMLYVMLGHRIANTTVAGAARSPMDGIDQLGAAMLIAVVAASPFGIVAAEPAFTHPVWLAWGVGVGLCSSVVPYVTDQLAMARVPRATFALMLALLPAMATFVGLVVLSQVPTLRDIAGVSLVIAGVALHHPPNATEESEAPEAPARAANGKESWCSTQGWAHRA